MGKTEKVLFLKMSSRGFLLRMPDDDDSYDPKMRPISPNIIISRSEYFAAQEGGEKFDKFFGVAFQGSNRH